MFNLLPIFDLWGLTARYSTVFDTTLLALEKRTVGIRGLARRRFVMFNCFYHDIRIVESGQTIDGDGGEFLYSD